jgi:hypothetical protein
LTYLIKIGGFQPFRVYGGEAYAIQFGSICPEAHSQTDSQSRTLIANCGERSIAFQIAEVAIPRELFADILRLIAELRPPPDPVPA